MKVLLSNYTVKVWFKKFEDVLEEPSVVFNCQPGERVGIAFGDDTLYVNDKNFVVEVTQPRDANADLWDGIEE